MEGLIDRADELGSPLRPSTRFRLFITDNLNPLPISPDRAVDHVIIGESAQSLTAASREQFYVSASRRCERVTIYAEDNCSLLEVVQKDGDSPSATELVTNERQSRLATMRKHVIRNQSFERPAVLPHVVPTQSGTTSEIRWTKAEVEQIITAERSAGWRHRTVH